jgi:hypothetical protein
MKAKAWTRLLVIVGPLMMLIGAVDPLEGSVLIALGAVLGALGVRLGGRPNKRPLLWGMAVIGALALCLPVMAVLRHQVVILIPFGLVALGLLMFGWGLRRAAPSATGCVYMSALLTVVGVAALWITSSFGGFGEGALSWWWALVCLPYPVGWLRHLYSVGRWIGEGDAPQAAGF